jgi:hypothetical protein
MGYTYTLSGQIAIDPPLTYAEMNSVHAPDFFLKRKSGSVAKDVRDTRRLQAILIGATPTPSIDARADYSNVKVEVKTNQSSHDDGLFISYRGLLVVPTKIPNLSNPDSDLQLLAEMFGKNHIFVGKIYGKGELGDYRRWSINGTTVVTEEARLMWPDGLITDIED